MRRNWLASAAVAAVATSIPVTFLAGPAFVGPAFADTAFAGTAFAGTARAATLNDGQQQKTVTASAAEAPKRVLRNATEEAPVTWNMVAAALAKRLVGDPYTYGGTSTAGFDCSGLTQFVYGHAGHGKHIDRMADDQFRQFRQISQSIARPGDLVFFHVTSSPSSLVYHVGVYEGGDNMVAAATYAEGVRFQSFTWGGDTVTFGTITH